MSKWTPKLHRQRNKLKAVQYLGGKCLDCGIDDVRVLEFDHAKNPRNGKLTVSSYLQGSWRRLQLHVDECELVCANCHAIRTANRLSKDMYSM